MDSLKLRFHWALGSSTPWPSTFSRVFCLYEKRVLGQCPPTSGLDQGTEEDTQGSWELVWLQTSNPHPSWPLLTDVYLRCLLFGERKEFIFWDRNAEFINLCMPCSLFLGFWEQGSFHCKNWGCETEASWKIPLKRFQSLGDRENLGNRTLCYRKGPGIQLTIPSQKPPRIAGHTQTCSPVLPRIAT